MRGSFGYGVNGSDLKTLYPPESVSSARSVSRRLWFSKPELLECHPALRAKTAHVMATTGGDPSSQGTKYASLSAALAAASR